MKKYRLILGALVALSVLTMAGFAGLLFAQRDSSEYTETVYGDAKEAEGMQICAYSVDYWNRGFWSETTVGGKTESAKEENYYGETVPISRFLMKRDWNITEMLRARFGFSAMHTTNSSVLSYVPQYGFLTHRLNPDNPLDAQILNMSRQVPQGKTGAMKYWILLSEFLEYFPISVSMEQDYKTVQTEEDYLKIKVPEDTEIEVNLHYNDALLDSYGEIRYVDGYSPVTTFPYVRPGGNYYFGVRRMQEADRGVLQMYLVATTENGEITFLEQPKLEVVLDCQAETTVCHYHDDHLVVRDNTTYRMYNRKPDGTFEQTDYLELEGYHDGHDAYAENECSLVVRDDVLQIVDTGNENGFAVYTIPAEFGEKAYAHNFDVARKEDKLGIVFFTPSGYHIYVLDHEKVLFAGVHNPPKKDDTVFLGAYMVKWD